tara:strand:- start:3013 stop:3324 length:312 start_codon:yes stop_codon:yes gene_type:complete
MSAVANGGGKSGGGGGGGKKPNGGGRGFGKGHTQKITAQNKKNVKKLKKPGMVGLQQLPDCPTCGRAVPNDIRGKRITRRIAMMVKKHYAKGATAKKTKKGKK